MYLINGFKVFMDARSTVTAKEGDRYPLKPPKPTLGPLDVNGYDKGCSCRASERLNCHSLIGAG